MEQNFIERYSQDALKTLINSGVKEEEAKNMIKDYLQQAVSNETLLKSSEENFKTMKSFVDSSEKMIMTFLDQLYYQLMQIKVTQMKLEFFIKDFVKQQLSVDMYTIYDKEFEKVNEKNITKMLDKEYFTDLYNLIKREENENDLFR